MVNCVDCIFRGKCEFNQEQIKIEIGDKASMAIKVACSEGKTCDDVEKLDLINSMIVSEGDSDTDGSMIYVLVDDTEENVKVLEELGATEEDFKTMRVNENDEEYKNLDICSFAFNKLAADRWSKKEGFYFAQDEK